MGKYSLDVNKIKQSVIKDEEKRKPASSGNSTDNRFWKFTFDKDTKVGQAIVRFLPDPNDVPFKVYYSHWFNWTAGGTSGIYTKNCPTSIGKDCPVCLKNRELFKSVHKRDNDLSRQRKRKFHAVSNILVIKDPACPENEGKVFLWDHGTQIHDKYKKAMFGVAKGEGQEDLLGEEEEVFLPCDWYDGADFVVRSGMKPNTDWMTYDDSRFKKQAPLFPELSDDERDECIADLIKQLHPLDEWDKDNKYPDFESIQKELAPILGISVVSSSSDDDDIEDDDFADDADDIDDVVDPELDDSDDFVGEEPPAEKPKKKSSNEPVDNDEYIKSILAKGKQKKKRA